MTLDAISGGFAKIPVAVHAPVVSQAEVRDQCREPRQSPGIREHWMPDVSGMCAPRDDVDQYVHTALGIVSYQGMEWITRAIQGSNAGPLRYAWIFAFLIPIPMFLVTLWGLHRHWIPKHWVVSAVAVILLVWGHIGGWRAGFRR